MPQTKAPAKNIIATQPKKIINPKLINFATFLTTLRNKQTAKSKNIKFVSSPRKNKSQILLIKHEKIAHQVENLSIAMTNQAITPITPASAKIEELVLIAQAQASLVGFDEINKLIKKLTLSFSTQKNESNFLIKTGIFEGARFFVKCQEKDMHLKINNIASRAHQILGDHKDYLRLRLSLKEINLRSIMFNS